MQPIGTLTSAPLAVGNANGIGVKGGVGSAVGTFAPSAWSLFCPFRQLTLNANGSFQAQDKRGGSAQGAFRFDDGDSSLMESLTLLVADGSQRTFAVNHLVKEEASGRVAKLTLQEVARRPTDVHLPFTMYLSDFAR